MNDGIESMAQSDDMWERPAASSQDILVSIPPVNTTAAPGLQFPHGGRSSQARNMDSASSLPAVRPMIGVWQNKVKEIMKAQQITADNETPKLMKLLRKPGAEPGLDIKKFKYINHADTLKGDCSIVCVDYGSSKVAVSKPMLSGFELKEFLRQPRPEWAQVRWLDVSGLNWEMLEVLVHEHNIHPLALEDVVHVPQRIKADFFDDHCYISMLLLTCEESSKLDTQIERQDTAHRRRLMSNLRSRVKLAELSSFFRKEYLVEQAALFMFANGTVISIFLTQDIQITQPIRDRLEEPSSVLRTTGDPSMLLHGLMDSIVDHALPLVDAFQNGLADLEAAVLWDKPDLLYTYELHRLQADLSLLKRTMVPTKQLVDALINKQVEGKLHLSPMAKMYLRDVQDHANTVVESMDDLISQGDALVNLAFNIINHKNSQSMAVLSVVSTVFLPLTFIAGIYGTNFDVLPELHWEWGYGWFYILCVLSTVVMCAYMYSLGIIGTSSALNASEASAVGERRQRRASVASSSLGGNLRS